MFDYNGFNLLAVRGSEKVPFNCINFGLTSLSEDLVEMCDHFDFAIDFEGIVKLADYYDIHDPYRFALDEIKRLCAVQEKLLQMLHFGIVEDIDLIASDLAKAIKVHEDFILQSVARKGGFGYAD